MDTDIPYIPPDPPKRPPVVVYELGFGFGGLGFLVSFLIFNSFFSELGKYMRLAGA